MLNIFSHLNEGALLHMLGTMELLLAVSVKHSHIRRLVLEDRVVETHVKIDALSAGPGSIPGRDKFPG